MLILLEKIIESLVSYLFPVRFNEHATSLTTVEGRYLSEKAR